MYNKILVVEDQDTVGHGILSKLQAELGIKNITLSQYCDEAYLKYQRAMLEKNPFQLLITDLSFNLDYREGAILTGKEFIAKITELGQQTPIIVCSVEDRPAAIKNLMKEQLVLGYVHKGRNGLKDLVDAIHWVYRGTTYISPGVSDALRKKDTYEIQEYDINLLKLLSNGLTQEQISYDFEAKGVSPASLSSIEKRLNKLKDVLKANNNVQLVANAKDIGLI